MAHSGVHPFFQRFFSDTLPSRGDEPPRIRKDGLAELHSAIPDHRLGTSVLVLTIASLRHGACSVERFVKRWAANKPILHVQHVQVACMDGAAQASSLPIWSSLQPFWASDTPPVSHCAITTCTRSAETVPSVPECKQSYYLPVCKLLLLSTTC